MQIKKENMQGNKTDRREFLKKSLLTGSVLAAGSIGLEKVFPKDENNVSAPDTIVHDLKGNLYKTCCTNLHKYQAPEVTNEEARKGIRGKKFVMVIDTAKCDGCKKCTEACQAMHFSPPDREYIKVYKMKEAESTQSYFLPKPCFHCDNPPCTKVCPVGATFKREDGIVLIDNERCIGCRSCMAACPYSTRFFNWSHPSSEELAASGGIPYSPEIGLPRRMGTVEKCDFCPHMIRQGKMPACVTGCPMEAIYFGDQNEDAVTNSAGVTLKFSQLIEDNGGYRYLEELGTEPRVYYLSVKNRKYPQPDMEDIHNDMKEEDKVTKDMKSCCEDMKEMKM